MTTRKKSTQFWLIKKADYIEFYLVTACQNRLCSVHLYATTHVIAAHKAFRKPL